MPRLTRNIIPLLALGLAGALAVGCGGGKPSAGAGQASAPAPKQQAVSEEYEERIVGAESKTLDEKCAACEAMRCAEDANPGSCFKASRVKVAGGWARVAVEESGVPAEEAVGFEVFLQRHDDGTWEVAETGNNITRDQLPGAPPELFK